MLQLFIAIKELRNLYLTPSIFVVYELLQQKSKYLNLILFYQVLQVSKQLFGFEKMQIQEICQMFVETL